MNLKNKLAQNKFAVTAEIGPPKGVNVAASLAEVEGFKAFVDAVNVTDLQSSAMKAGSLVLSHLLIDAGVEPILQVTCRDRNRLALQSDLLSAYILGIRNVLALTGDHPAAGDHPEAKPVFDLDAITLLKTIQTLTKGTDLAGKKLEGKPDFFAGAVVNPGAEPVEAEILKMEKKIAAGAAFFQTQAVFDPKIFEAFMKKVRHFNVPILAGVVILKSAKMANYMNKNVSGVTVPASSIQQLQNSKDVKATSVEIASGIIKNIKGFCQGVHIMPLGSGDSVVPILKESDLI